MRTLVVTENITLDGVIDTEGGWFQPSGESDVDQSDVAAILREQAAASDALLTGRVTFEDMRGYWPQQTGDTTGIAEHLNRVAKYVVGSNASRPTLGSTSPCYSDPKSDDPTPRSSRMRSAPGSGCPRPSDGSRSNRLRIEAYCSATARYRLTRSARASRCSPGAWTAHPESRRTAGDRRIPYALGVARWPPGPPTKGCDSHAQQGADDHPRQGH